MKLLINQSTGYLCIDIANALIENDEVVLMCSNPKAMKNLNPMVKTVGIIAYDKSSTIKRLFTWVVATIQIWWIVITRYRKIELLIVSNPPFANLLALLLPNKEVSHLIYDIYPDVLVSANFLKKGSLLDRLWSKGNRSIYRKAKHVYTIGEGMAQSLSRYLPKEKVEVIPLWPNTSGLYEVKKENNRFINEHQLEGKFIVLYSGNFGNTHKVESLVAAAERLREYERIHFVIIGGGGKKKMIQEKIKEFGLHNVTLLPYQSLGMLSHSLGCADLAVVTLDVNTSQLSVPSKTFNLMYLGKPILCLGSENSELARLVKEHKIGILCNPDNIYELAFCIQNLAKKPELLEEYKKNSKETSKLYSVENAKMFLS